MSFLNELKRRNVVKVTIAYIVMAWLVMQVADVILGNIVAPVWVFHVLLLFLAVGLPFTVFFAWAFELTPEGLKRESEVDRSQSITTQTGRKLDFLIIGVLVLALGYFAYDKFVLSTTRDTALVEATRRAVTEQATAESELATEPNKSIAVLPFINMSSDEEQEYFSDGLSEELLNLLARIPDLRVAARTSSFSFKGQNLEIPEIAKRLNVAHILEGSVRKAGDQVRITTQLIKADDGYHMWSQSYDRSLDNIFAVQDEIAANVVEQLKVTLLGEAPKTIEINGEAYAMYMQANHVGQQFTVDAFEQSNALYEQALEIAPDYAPAYIKLGTNYLKQSDIGVLPVPEATSRAREFFQKALEIDPLNGNAYAMLGWLDMIYENELAEAAEHFEKALTLNPGELNIVANSAVLAATLARMDEALALAEYIAERDPLDTLSHINLANAYYFSHQPEKSVESSRTALRLHPGHLGVHELISLAYLMKGKPEAALQAIEQEDYEVGKDHTRALVYFSLGREDEFRRALESFIDRESENAPGRLASIYAWSGQIDQAFDWLDRAAASNDSFLAMIPVDPTLASLHDDPRWLSFLESIGKSPEQLAAIEFKVTLPK